MLPSPTGLVAFASTVQASPHDVMMSNPEPAGDPPAYWFHFNGSTVQALHQASFPVSSWRHDINPCASWNLPCLIFQHQWQWQWQSNQVSRVEASQQPPLLFTSWRQQGTPLPDFSTSVQLESARPLISNHRVWVWRESEKTATPSVFLLRYPECQDSSSSCSSLPILAIFSPPLPLAQCQGRFQFF